MTQTHDTPIFNLKAVVQETGLKPDTLRAWERRYGLPEPQRTASGHRLYTQRDIDTLKWLIARQNEGLNISRAVALWHELEADKIDPLNPHIMPSAAGSQLPIPPQVALPSGRSADTISTLRDQWVAACLTFDEQAAEATLSSAFALFPVETVCLALIQRGLAMIGVGWYEGKITVQQEHFASALAMRRLETLLAATPIPTRSERILLGCPPEESHTFVPLVLALLLRRRGWNVLYLGADIPIRSLELTVKTTRPALVILTAQQLSTAASLFEMSQVLLAERVALGFGGMIFNEISGLAAVIPGYFLGNQLDSAIQQIEQIMPAPRPQAAQQQVDRIYIDALHHFQNRRARIEADIWKNLEQSGMPQRHLSAANANLGRNIIAALTLGNMEFLGADMAWIEGLLVHHYQMPLHLLDEYLAAYYAAARTHLTPKGGPVLRWLAQLIDGHADSVIEQLTQPYTHYQYK
jgi:DNA-binding transcriptional MerR regulator